MTPRFPDPGDEPWPDSPDPRDEQLPLRPHGRTALETWRKLGVPMTLHVLALGGIARAARAAAGLTQRDLAGRSGVSLLTVTQLEAGRRVPEAPTFASVRRVVRSLGVSAALVRGRFLIRLEPSVVDPTLARFIETWSPADRRIDYRKHESMIHYSTDRGNAPRPPIRGGATTEPKGGTERGHSRSEQERRMADWQKEQRRGRRRMPRRPLAPEAALELLALGPALRTARGLLALNQRDFAQRAQISEMTLRSVEQGSLGVEASSVRAIGRVLHELGVAVELWGGALVVGADTRDVGAEFASLVESSGTSDRYFR